YLVRLEGEASPKRSRGFKRVAYVLVGFTGLVVLLTNWKTFVFAAIAIPTLYLLHTRVLDPIARRFQHQTVPRMTAGYRRFLGWMLERDYTPKRALLRNTFALGSFTVGFLLLILVAFVGSLSQAGGILLAVPVGLLLLVASLGIVFHAP